MHRIKVVELCEIKNLVVAKKITKKYRMKCGDHEYFYTWLSS